MENELKTFILELRAIVRAGHTAAIGADDKEMIQIYQVLVRALHDKLDDQSRAIAFARGEPYSPKVHSAEAILIGVGGQQ